MHNALELGDDGSNTSHTQMHRTWQRLVQQPEFRPALNAVVLHYLPGLGSGLKPAAPDQLQQDQHLGSSTELPSVPNVHEADQMQQAVGAANVEVVPSFTEPNEIGKNIVDLEVVPDGAIASGSHVAEVETVKLCGLPEQIDFFGFVDGIAPDQDEIEFFAKGVHR